MKAIILCAGIGTRLRPITEIKPKPLLEIGGISLLSRIISMLHSCNIRDITVVAGYKHEQVKAVTDKYDIDFVISDKYDTCNNNTSIKLVKHKLNDCFIIDGDLYLQRNVFEYVNPNISQFISQQIINKDEWGLNYDNNNRVYHIEKGVTHGYGASGISFWTGNTAKALVKELDNCKPEEFWEDAVIRILEKHEVYITKIPNCIVEIDSIYDGLSKNILTADEIAEQSSIVMPQKLKGLTNNTYLIDFGKGKKVLRVPGIGTNDFIEREKEEQINEIIKSSNIAPETEYYSNGVKVSQFLEGYRNVEKKDYTETFCIRLAERLKELHKYKLNDYPNFKSILIKDQIIMYENITKITLLTPEEHRYIIRLAEELDNDEQVLSHKDLLCDNIMIKDGDIKIIDFEYSDFTSVYWDIANVIIEAELDPQRRDLFIQSYGGLDSKKVYNTELVVDYLWGLWGWVNNCIDYGRRRISRFTYKFDAITYK